MRRNNKTVSKANLPSKQCPICERPFTWRKRWESCWQEVIYCSDACRRQRQQQNKQRLLTL